MSEQKKFETILLTNRIVTEEQLEQITSYAQAVGIDLCEAVLQKKLAPPETVMMAYAESLGLPFVRVGDISVDENVVIRIDSMTARQYSVVPVSIDQGYVLLITTKPVIPDIADEFRMIFNMPVRSVLCLPSELSATIAKYYPRDSVRVVRSENSKEVSKSVGKKTLVPVEPMSDDEKKDRFMKTFMTFNFSVAFIYFFSSYLFLPKWVLNSSSMFPSICFIGGCIAAGIVWRALSR